MQMEDDEIEAEAAEEQEDSSGPRKLIWNHWKDNQYDSKRLGSNRWYDAILANSCEISAFWIKFFDDFIIDHKLWSTLNPPFESITLENLSNCAFDLVKNLFSPVERTC